MNSEILGSCVVLTRPLLTYVMYQLMAALTAGKLLAAPDLAKKSDRSTVSVEGGFH
jgi:hypothetical protein